MTELMKKNEDTKNKWQFSQNITIFGGAFGCKAIYCQAFVQKELSDDDFTLKKKLCAKKLCLQWNSFFSTYIDWPKSKLT